MQDQGLQALGWKEAHQRRKPLQEIRIKSEQRHDMSQLAELVPYLAP